MLLRGASAFWSVMWEPVDWNGLNVEIVRHLLAVICGLRSEKLAFCSRILYWSCFDVFLAFVRTGWSFLLCAVTALLWLRYLCICRTIRNKVICEKNDEAVSKFRFYLLLFMFPVLFLLSVVQYWKFVVSYLLKVIIFVAYVVCNYVLLSACKHLTHR